LNNQKALLKSKRKKLINILSTSINCKRRRLKVDPVSKGIRLM